MITEVIRIRKAVNETISKPTFKPIDNLAIKSENSLTATIAILEKIEAEPGIKTDEILERFTEFERDEISPPLTPVFLEVMLEALLDMNYIEIHDKRTYATGKEPPSRPKIG